MELDIKKLSKCTVLDENSNHVLLESFWKSSPAIMIFLRHFG